MYPFTDRVVRRAGWRGHGLLSVRRFIIFFSVLLFLSLILAIYLQTETFQIVEEEAKERNILLLEQTKQMVDRYIEEVQALSHRLALDSSISEFLKMEPLQPGSARLQDIIESSETVSNYAFQNPFVKNVFVFSRKNGYILSIDRTFLDPELTYGSLWRIPGLSYAQWKSQYLEPHHRHTYLSAREMVSESQTSRIILYLQSLPLEYSKMNHGKLVILLDETILLNVMKSLELGDSGYARIIGADGTTLVSYAPNTENTPALSSGFSSVVGLPKTTGTSHTYIEGVEYILTSTISNLTGWSFYSLLPIKDLQSRVSFVTRAYGLLSLVFLIVLGAAALLFSWRESVSWKAIRFVLTSYDDLLVSKDDFQSIRLSISNLMENNLVMRNFQRSQRPEMLKMILRRILHGRMKDRDELGAMERYLEIDLSGSFFAVFIVKISLWEDVIDVETLQTLDFYRLLLQDMLSGSFENRYLSVEEEPGQIVYLAWWNDVNGEEIPSHRMDTLLNLIHQDLAETGQMDHFIAAGHIVQSIMEAGMAYLEAHEVLKFLSMREQVGLLWFRDLPDHHNAYYYPLDLENRLLNLMRGGETERAGLLIEHLFEENLTVRSLSPNMLEQFFTVLKGTILRLDEGDSGRNVNFFERIDTTTGASTDHIKEQFKSVVAELTGLTDDLRKEKKGQLRRSVEEFLEENYGSKNLNLSVLADRYSLKESYLYFFFRNYLGSSFSSYLSNLRLEKAKLMLSEENDPVNDIADDIGYANAQTFRRAFKKATGMTPTRFRETKREFTG